MMFKAASVFLALLFTLLALVAADAPVAPGRLPSNPRLPWWRRPGRRPPHDAAPTEMPRIPELPPAKGLRRHKHEPYSVLGGMDAYNVDDPKHLFENFNNKNRPLFSLLDDFFAASPGYLKATNEYSDAGLTGAHNPFQPKQTPPSGELVHLTRTVTSRHKITPYYISFDPVSANGRMSWLEISRRLLQQRRRSVRMHFWSILCPGPVEFAHRWMRKCNDVCTGTKTHDQVWCSVAQIAESYTNYCTSNNQEHRFAAKAPTTLNHLAPRLTDDEPTLASTSYVPSPASVANGGSTPTLTLVAVELPSGLASPPSNSAGFSSPASSWSSRSRDSSSSYVYSHVFVTGTLMYLFRNCAALF